MGLTSRNVLINLGYYGATLLLGPWGALTLERWLGFPAAPASELRGISLVLGVPAVALQAWCIILLQRDGGGTPSPAVPTTRLVIHGPYRWVRNPLNVGEVLLFFSLACWFHSWLLLAYTLAAGLAFHVFVCVWEEPRHAREFGAAYNRYRQTVNRWLPIPPSLRRVP